MNQNFFTNEAGVKIPSVSEEQMREADCIAEKEYGLSILQMMENAGRNLTLNVMELIQWDKDKIITITAGTGGNGGGGICSARHLLNRGYKINLLLTRNIGDYTGPAKSQLKILLKSGFKPLLPNKAKDVLSRTDIVVDALIGYSLRGAPKGRTEEYINLINSLNKRVLALDLPSGINATTGETPGVYIKATRTLTLALPKPGLTNPASGDIFLADIGIPPEVFRQMGIIFNPFFNKDFYIRIFPKTI